MRYVNVLIILVFTLPSFLYSTTTLKFSYEELKKLIFSKHPDLRNSQYNVDISINNERSALYARLPSLTFGIAGFPAAPYAYNSINRGFVIDPYSWSPIAGVFGTIGIPIYDFGKISNLQDAAHYQTLAQELEIDVTKQNVLLALKKLYWGYLTYNSFKKYVFDIVSPEYDKMLHKKDKDFKSGKIPRSSMENFHIDFLNFKEKALELEASKKSLDRQIAVLLSASSEEDMNIDFQVQYVYPLDAKIQSYTYYLGLARVNNAKIKKMEQDFLASQAYAKAEYAKIWPNLSFGINYSYTYYKFAVHYDVLNNIYPDKGFKFQFGFNLSWDLNIWQKLNTAQQVDRQTAKLQESMKSAIASLENDLRGSYDDVVYQKSILEYQNEILSIARRNFIFTTKAQALGNASNDDIVSALQKFYTYLQAYYRQIQVYNLSIAQFESLMGTNMVDYPSQEKQEIQSESLLSDDKE